MVFNATFNNISVISWRSVLLVEETEIPGENHRPAASHWQRSSQNVVSSTPRLFGLWTHIMMSSCTFWCIGAKNIIIMILIYDYLYIMTLHSHIYSMKMQKFNIINVCKREHFPTMQSIFVNTDGRMENDLPTKKVRTIFDIH